MAAFILRVLSADEHTYIYNNFTCIRPNINDKNITNTVNFYAGIGHELCPIQVYLGFS